MAELTTYYDGVCVIDRKMDSDTLAAIRHIAAVIAKHPAAKYFATTWKENLYANKMSGKYINPVYSWRAHILAHRMEYYPHRLNVFEGRKDRITRLAIDVLGHFKQLADFACRISAHTYDVLFEYWFTSVDQYVNPDYIPAYMLNDWPWDKENPMCPVPTTNAIKDDASVIDACSKMYVTVGRSVKNNAERDTTMQVAMTGSMRVSRTELLEKLRGQIAALLSAINDAEASLEAALRDQALPQLVNQVVKAGGVSPLIAFQLPNLGDARQQLTFLRDYAAALDVGSSSELELPTATVIQLLRPFAITVTYVTGTWNLAAKVV